MLKKYSILLATYNTSGPSFCWPAKVNRHAYVTLVGHKSLDLSVWENRYKISKKNQTANAKPFIHSDRGRGEKPRSNNCDIIAYLCNEKQGQSDFHSKKKQVRSQCSRQSTGRPTHQCLLRSGHARPREWNKAETYICNSNNQRKLCSSLRYYMLTWL
jgi:hypothetical protein